MNKNGKIKKDQIKLYLGIGILSVGVLTGLVIMDTKEKNNSPQTSYEQIDINLPEGCRFETIDDKIVVVRQKKIYAIPYEYIDENGEVKCIAPNGYYLEKEYYSYKIIKKIKNNSIVEEKIYNTVEISVDDNGVVNYIVPEGYIIGIKYTAVKIVDEVFYLDDYITSNNKFNGRKLMRSLNENGDDND